MHLTQLEQWAFDQFGHANLKDPRRTERLVKLATALAQQPGDCVSQLPLSPADMEGSYRFIRNHHVNADAIADAGFATTAALARDYDLLLALEDTTALTFNHASVHDELGHTNQGSSRALLAHSVLLFAPHKSQVVGMIAQRIWTRDVSKRGESHRHATRPYKEKESRKWEEASVAFAARLGTQMANVISVCDREADIYEYLHYKQSNQQRFVVRSMQSRCIEEHDHKLYDYARQCHSAGTKVVKIPQRGGRKAREAVLDIKFTKVTLKAPANKRNEPDIPLYYVGCIEQGDASDRLEWHLLTSEAVTDDAQARKVIGYYERRWLIEDYHKVWKSAGTRVETLRMQSMDNLKRMCVILSFIAVRLLQLRFINEESSAQNQSCETVIGPTGWKLLWRKVEKTPLPTKVPDMRWAYRSLAKLGGWKDTKRTGRASIAALWEGWFRLQTLLEGYELAQSLEHQ
ncbi:IS4 family transposase [Aeromonas veronii]